MGRPRKRHVQTEMRLKFDKNGQRRGGPQPKAGRKPNGPHAGVSHLRRVEVNPRHPKHITLRVYGRLAGFGDSTRSPPLAGVPRGERKHPELSDRSHQRAEHASASDLRSRVEVGARARTAGLPISAAKTLNAAISKRRRTERHGGVFTDRYHREDLDTPWQVRNALVYVINNWRRHGVDRNALFALYDGASIRTRADSR